jgi:hypothetical protein
MAIDADLRSALSRYFESLLDGDQKLRADLSKIAKAFAPDNRIHKLIFAHMAQLSARAVKTEDLLKQIEVPDGPPAPPAVEQRPEPDTLTPPTMDDAEEAPTHTLTPFEETLVHTYNSEPGNWRRSYRPASFGASNVDEIWKTGGDPKFTRKEGGIYHLVEAENRGYVVPEPGLRLQENYFRSEGINHLFVCCNFRPGASWARILLVSPAVVQEHGDRWTVLEKGELRERT